MAGWSRNKVDSATLNRGNEYSNDSVLAVDELNAMVNAGLFAQDFVEQLGVEIDTSEAGYVGTPSVELIDGVNSTIQKPYKRFKFKNLKGEKGDKGDKGTTGSVGATPDITMNAFMLSADSSPTVSKTGTNENPNFALGIPRGQKGEKGDKGDKGDVGVIGMDYEGYPTGNALTGARYDPETKTLYFTRDVTFLKQGEAVSSVAGNTGEVTSSQLVSAILTGANSYGDKIVAKSLAQNGYIQYVSGLCIQWGRTSYGTTSLDNGIQSISFPTSFSSIYTVVGTWQKGDNTTREWNIYGQPSTTGFSFRKNSVSDSVNGWSWIAIGKK